MTEWVPGYMGRHSVGPEMMWGDPGRLTSTCEQWMIESPPTGITDPPSWCSSMVAWMTSHMRSWTGRADWGGWMMDGPMLGR